MNENEPVRATPEQIRALLEQLRNEVKAVLNPVFSEPARVPGKKREVQETVVTVQDDGTIHSVYPDAPAGRPQRQRGARTKRNQSDGFARIGLCTGDATNDASLYRMPNVSTRKTRKIAQKRRPDVSELGVREQRQVRKQLDALDERVYGRNLNAETLDLELCDAESWFYAFEDRVPEKKKPDTPAANLDEGLRVLKAMYDSSRS